MAKKKSDIQYYESVGRRRESVARARLHIVSSKDGKILIGESKMSKGDVVINGKQLQEYFPSVAEKNLITKPFEVTNNLDRFVTTIVVKGGGKSGQVTAVSSAISRALCLTDEAIRPLLKAEGLLTRDSRVRERRKVGTGGKARRQKQSPKR